MIRDRLKGLAKKVAIKAFGMEWEAEELAPNDSNSKRSGPQEFDPNLIPRVVDGSGDTPGPKHRERIGRTWLASQVVSGEAGVIVDLRSPKEVVAGMLPGAILIPAAMLKTRTEKLPAKTVRITLYDQTGAGESDALAAWLREQGWGVARMLQGGFAEWIEHDEPVKLPQPPEGGTWHVGNPVEIKKGKKRGVVLEAWHDAGAKYTVLLDDGSLAGPLGDADLSS